MLAAALVPWGLGLLFGRLIVRLQGLTLAFATFAFMEVVQVFFLNSHSDRGRTWSQRHRAFNAALARLGLVFGCWCSSICRLRHSRIGRAMAMVKHDEVVAVTLGVNVPQTKVLAFAAGALVAGIGGALYAHYALYIQYSDFGADKALALLTYAVFGGIDVWFGGMLGAAVLFPICPCCCKSSTTGVLKFMAPSFLG